MKINKASLFMIIFLIITAWVFGGFSHTFNFPPEIKQAKAQSTAAGLVPVSFGSQAETGWLDKAGTQCSNSSNNPACFDEVNDAPASPDGDNTYIQKGTERNINVSFDANISSIPNGSTITGIDVTFVCKRTGGTNTSNVRGLYAIGGVVDFFNSNADCPGTGSYGTFTHSFTGLSILKGASTDLEIGVRGVQNRPVNVTSIYADVTYIPISIPAPTVTPTTGAAPPTVVSFSGLAFPGAKIAIISHDLPQDFPLVQKEVVDLGGYFEIEFTGPPRFSGSPSFGLAAVDKDGRSTQSQVYNLGVSGSLAVGNILLPPTAGFFRTAVTKGDFLVINGYALTMAAVEIELDGKIIKEVQAGSDGYYKLLFNTAGLSFGEHAVRVRQRPIGRLDSSDFSPQKIFTVSRLLVPETDLNSDGMINISDWSIFLARWQSSDAALRNSIDLNGDGKIDIADFSIFIRTIKR